MHPNPVFRKVSTAQNLALARDRSFGVLSVNAQEGPLMAHIPFQISEDGAYLEAHLVRSNPIAQAVKTPLPAVVVVSGGDGYISPDWYGIEDQVPTWNYVAVHLRGTVKRLPDSDLQGVLDRLSHAMEHRLAPKPIWTLDKLKPETMKRMMRQIVPIVMEIKNIEGTWKLNQNKQKTARLTASQALAGTGFGLNYNELADLMQNLPEEGER